MNWTPTEAEREAVATAIVTRREFDETGQVIFEILTPRINKTIAQEHVKALRDAADRLTRVTRPEGHGELYATWLRMRADEIEKKP